MALQSLYDMPAPAKLNLFLHVTGRRADGYHLLQSVFVLIDWCDTLHFERRGDGRISREDLGPALPEDDLSVRAARALQQAAGVEAGAHIGVAKAVPWGAGLGGGSSDAATTLLALNRLWGLGWPRARLAEIALKLGADVPFFVGGRNAWVEGIGERLSPVEVPPALYAVLKPTVSVPTAAIFGNPALPRNTPAAILSDFLADPFRFGQNDLQGCAVEFSAEVGEALGRLAQRWGSSRMSGSGSAVFACVGREPGPGGPTAHIPRFEPATLPQGWVGRLCRGLDQHPLVHWAED
jgi:4-diphosphocytidyl-2-C-methyl-D-erythritol kinase